MVFAYFRQFPHCSPRSLDFNYGAAVAELWVSQKEANDHLRFSISPFLKRKEAIQLLKTRSVLEACERAGWLVAVTRQPRLVLYKRQDVMACVYRISEGEFP
jgi:hypothetical protein